MFVDVYYAFGADIITSYSQQHTHSLASRVFLSMVEVMSNIWRPVWSSLCFGALPATLPAGWTEVEARCTCQRRPPRRLTHSFGGEMVCFRWRGSLVLRRRPQGERTLVRRRRRRLRDDGGRCHHFLRRFARGDTPMSSQLCLVVPRQLRGLGTSVDPLERVTVRIRASSLRVRARSSVCSRPCCCAPAAAGAAAAAASCFKSVRPPLPSPLSFASSCSRLFDNGGKWLLKRQLTVCSVRRAVGSWLRLMASLQPDACAQQSATEDKELAGRN